MCYVSETEKPPFYSTRTTSMSKVWFITGTSKGFGRIWAEAALDRGDRVAATARNVDTLAAGRAVRRPGAGARRSTSPTGPRSTPRRRGARAVRPPGRGGQQRRLRAVRHDRGGQRAQARARSRPTCSAPVGHPGGAADPARAGLGPHRPGVLDRRRQRVPGLGLYHASKWGLEGLSQSLAGRSPTWASRSRSSSRAATPPTGPARRRSPPTDPAYESPRAGASARATPAELGDPEASGPAILEWWTPTSRRCACSSAPACSR